MDATFQSLANNPFVILGSFVLAILGIVLAVIFFLRSQRIKIPCYERIKIPCYEVSSTTIIDGLHKTLDGLEIHYSGSVQERITVTKVVFWNDGKETINESDLTEIDPLRLVCPKSVEILNIQVINYSAESNSIQIGKRVSHKNLFYYPLKFEYIDNAEYFVVQIIHNADSKQKFHVKGKIKGVKNIERSTGSQIASSAMGVYMPLVGSLFGKPLALKYSLIIAYFLIFIFTVWNLFTGNTQWFVWLGSIFSLFALIAVFFGLRRISPINI